MRIAVAISLTEEERVVLTRWSRGRRTPARLVLRAAVGLENQAIAAELGCTRRTVGTWRKRFATQRLAGIESDAPRGRRSPPVRSVKEAEVLAEMTRETPPNATHWSVRTMAKATGISRATVQRIWRDHHLQPQRVKTFKVSNDPQFAEKLVDVVGLSLDPPDRALVLCTSPPPAVRG